MKINNLLHIITNLYRRYCRNLASWEISVNRKRGVISRLFIANLLILLSFLLISLPWVVKILLVLLVFIPYLRIVVVKTRLYRRFNRSIRSNRFIGIQYTGTDLKARQRLLKKLISLGFTYIIILMILMHWIWDSKAWLISFESWLFSDIAVAGWLGILFYTFIFLAIKRRRWLVPILSLTSPFISLSLLLHMLNSLNECISKLTGIAYTNILNGFFDSYIYMFVQSGTDKQFAVYNFAYSFIFQMLFVAIQPVYKLEKSRLAMEAIAVIYGAVSIIGLLMAAPVSHFLFAYLQNSSGEGKEILIYAGLKNKEEFRQFFEQTLKFIILPFSLGTMIPIVIFKYREAASKSRGQLAFDRACVNPELPLDQMLPLLREALYYGGGSIRSAIYGHYLLHVFVPHLQVFKSKRLGWLYKVWNKINIVNLHINPGPVLQIKTA